MATSIQRRQCLAGLCGGAAALAAPAWANAPPAGRRVALVVGNSSYRPQALKNPEADAEAVAKALRQMGYEVTQRHNTTLAELIEAMRDFSMRGASAAVRTFYYAGHGIQARGRNFLLPVDVALSAEDEIAAKCADLTQFIDRVSGIKKGLNVVVLDACRVNPFVPGTYTGPDGRNYQFRGVPANGLARLDAPLGSFVAFSTAPNGVADDASGGPHSIYTRHLLQHIATPGLPVEQVFKRVRIGVAEETKRRQVPWESSSLTTEFCFKLDPQGRCG